VNAFALSFAKVTIMCATDVTMMPGVMQELSVTKDSSEFNFQHEWTLTSEQTADMTVGPDTLSL
jgi:hypothetical protein